MRCQYQRAVTGRTAHAERLRNAERPTIELGPSQDLANSVRVLFVVNEFERRVVRPLLGALTQHSRHAGPHPRFARITTRHAGRAASRGGNVMTTATLLFESARLCTTSTNPCAQRR